MKDRPIRCGICCPPESSDRFFRIIQIIFPWFSISRNAFPRKRAKSHFPEQNIRFFYRPAGEKTVRFFLQRPFNLLKTRTAFELSQRVKQHATGNNVAHFGRAQFTDFYLRGTHAVAKHALDPSQMYVSAYADKWAVKFICHLRTLTANTATV